MRRHLRVACVGHDIYFKNHFVERSAVGLEVEWFDFDHFTTDFYADLRAFQPDVTLIYRPELHRADQLNSLAGIKIGFSTEPLPKLSFDGEVRRSEEINRRVAVFRDIAWHAFNAVYHYDVASRSFCEKHGYPFAGYRILPVNTDYFAPRWSSRKLWDALFIGKATPRRQRILDRLKIYNRKFLWIEHGINGRELAALFHRARCVINIHADHLVALEPRVYLATAAGVPVLSDPLTTMDFPSAELVHIDDLDNLSFEMIDRAVEKTAAAAQQISEASGRSPNALSGRAFIVNAIDRLT